MALRTKCNSDGLHNAPHMKMQSQGFEHCYLCQRHGRTDGQDLGCRANIMRNFRTKNLRVDPRLLMTTGLLGAKCRAESVEQTICENLMPT